jgi:hypothetical protein
VSALKVLIVLKVLTVLVLMVLMVRVLIVPVLLLPVLMRSLAVWAAAPRASRTASTIAPTAKSFSTSTSSTL